MGLDIGSKQGSSTLEVQRVAKCATHLADLVDVRLMVLAVGWAAANGDSFCVRKVRMDGEREGRTDVTMAHNAAAGPILS